jgi:ATP-dependent helicase/nuclease subunit A
MSQVVDSAQALAADPAVNAFVTANAGSGKTKTLIDRVARLLLARTPPAAILCVTYTKAAAAEMQGRLFALLGDWSVLADDGLKARLADLLGEDVEGQDLAEARRLFAKALETPGGLRIQTIHAFCEQLLRRFPMEAGVSPNFTVMDDAAAAQVIHEARTRLARSLQPRTRGSTRTGEPDDLLSRAYGRMAVSLDYKAFEDLFATFEARRGPLLAYLEGLDGPGALEADVWRRCGFDQPSSAEAIEAGALAYCTPSLWRQAAGVLAAGSSTDQKMAAGFLAAANASPATLDGLLPLFFVTDGQGDRAKWIEKTAGLKTHPDVRAGLLEEQRRLEIARDLRRGARIAEDTVCVLTLCRAYSQAYHQAKLDRGVLDFVDLVARARDLVAGAPGAPWVLYKLDEGIEHILIDEAQDTAPEQWDIARALTDEFFSGEGRPRPAGSPDRTLFIVGDEKQSIYSFQGADPDRLLEETRGYVSRINGIQRRAIRAPLKTSYRSVRAVLDVVDAVFTADRTQDGVRPPSGDQVLRHEAFRSSQPGCVDLWPLEEESPDEQRLAWDLPLDLEREGSANRRLAERIAAEVKALIRRGDTVYDRKGEARPARYGDVIVLVRKRRALFEDIIRALRKAGVPVAGADRLVLSDHIAFHDLMALARFVLFPRDDLNLAALLKSPLCGLDDAQLYPLAHGRGDTPLWDRLLAATAPESVVWAVGMLRQTLDLAPGRPPFAFFSRVLGLTDPEGRSLRSRMVQRLGSEAGDVMEEFLARALEAESRGVLDLERLAAAFERLNISVKREMESGGDEVRVMTAHGAKGLEAPIVFLPETTTAASGRGSPLMETACGGFLWSASTEQDNGPARAARDRRKKREEGEAWRLLYVGLTRARDRLVLCGRKPLKAVDGTWRQVMDLAFDHPAIAPGVRTVTTPDGFQFRRYGSDPVPAVARASDPRPPVERPSWFARPADAGSPVLAWASPSQAASRARTPAASPLEQSGGLDRFRRGDIIHRLLQMLPDLPETERMAAARRMLDREPGLSPAQKDEMLAAAMGVLHHPDFAEVFAEGSRAEVALAGSAPELPGNLTISGRMDRIRVTRDRVLVVDFKTNRPAPAVVEQADPDHVAQLAIYAAVLRQIFPGRPVSAALVWTDGPKLMPLPEKMMAEALAALPGSR